MGQLYRGRYRYVYETESKHDGGGMKGVRLQGWVFNWFMNLIWVERKEGEAAQRVEGGAAPAGTRSGWCQ
ncbi:hypothetical protein L1887_31622 [Cichorium endivia]|nr:hypothetical protein L1887_31622 [Cichorium endivia]